GCSLFDVEPPRFVGQLVERRARMTDPTDARACEEDVVDAAEPDRGARLGFEVNLAVAGLGDAADGLDLRCGDGLESVDTTREQSEGHLGTLCAARGHLQRRPRAREDTEVAKRA